MILFDVLKTLTKKVEFKLAVPMFWRYYVLSLVFALLHILNFETLEFAHWNTYVVYLFVIFWHGSLFGYLRCRYGFFSGLLFHMLHNGLAFI